MRLPAANEVAARLSPTEFVERLNHFYAVATKAIVARDGTLDKLLAHEVVAFFGTPYNAEAHERRAVEAAEETIRAMDDKWSGASLVAAAVGTGTAFVGNVGTAVSRDYSAIGPIVDLTSSLALQARPGEILALPEVHAALHAQYAQATPRTLEIPGRAEPVHAWSLVVSGRTAPEASERILATVLFLDLVASTALAVSLGDAAWRELLARHYLELRRLLHKYDGTEIDTAGDGLLATFRAPVQAIAFGREAIDADERLGIRVRIGVHTGEVEREQAVIRGINVVVAARIGSLADAGQIFVSSTVRELVAGSGLTFMDRGAHVLKGVPDAREVYEVEATPAR
jgi:class 3 adenylate cyclase